MSSLREVVVTVVIVASAVVTIATSFSTASAAIFFVYRMFRPEVIAPAIAPRLAFALPGPVSPSEALPGPPLLDGDTPSQGLFPRLQGIFRRQSSRPASDPENASTGSQALSVLVALCSLISATTTLVNASAAVRGYWRYVTNASPGPGASVTSLTASSAAPRTTSTEVEQTSSAYNSDTSLSHLENVKTAIESALVQTDDGIQLQMNCEKRLCTNNVVERAIFNRESNEIETHPSRQKKNIITHPRTKSKKGSISFSPIKEVHKDHSCSSRCDRRCNKKNYRQPRSSQKEVDTKDVACSPIRCDKICYTCTFSQTFRPNAQLFFGSQDKLMFDSANESHEFAKRRYLRNSVDTVRSEIINQKISSKEATVPNEVPRPESERIRKKQEVDEIKRRRRCKDHCISKYFHDKNIRVNPFCDMEGPSEIPRSNARRNTVQTVTNARECVMKQFVSTHESYNNDHRHHNHHHRNHHHYKRHKSNKPSYHKREKKATTWKFMGENLAQTELLHNVNTYAKGVEWLADTTSIIVGTAEKVIKKVMGKSKRDPNSNPINSRSFLGDEKSRRPSTGYTRSSVSSELLDDHDDVTNTENTFPKYESKTSGNTKEKTNGLIRDNIIHFLEITTDWGKKYTKKLNEIHRQLMGKIMTTKRTVKEDKIKKDNEIIRWNSFKEIAQSKNARMPDSAEHAPRLCKLNPHMEHNSISINLAAPMLSSICLDDVISCGKQMNIRESQTRSAASENNNSNRLLRMEDLNSWVTKNYDKLNGTFDESQTRDEVTTCIYNKQYTKAIENKRKMEHEGSTTSLLTQVAKVMVNKNILRPMKVSSPRVRTLSEELSRAQHKQHRTYSSSSTSSQ